MSSSKQCKSGLSCAYLKSGTCKFLHSDAKRVGKKVAKRGPTVKTVVGKHVVKHAVFAMKAQKELSRALTGFVSVTAAGSTGKDVKMSWADQTEIDGLQQQVSALKAAARSAIGGQHIRVKLFVSSTVISGAGAALANWIGVIPSQTTEWASMITLYDECRVDSIVIRHIGGVSVSGATSASAGCVPYAIGYDPNYNTIPTSVEDVQESQFSQLKLFGATIGFSQSVCPVAFNEFKATIPKDGSVMGEDMKAKPNFPGAWMSCLDTVDSVGYIRYYVPALGGAAVNAIRIHLELNCEFRIRT